MRGMHTQAPPNRLRDMRLDRGQTLMDLATLCGVYPTTIKRWEKGLIPQQHLPALAEHLGVSVPYLAGWSPKRSAA